MKTTSRNFVLGGIAGFAIGLVLLLIFWQLFPNQSTRSENVEEFSIVNSPRVSVNYDLSLWQDLLGAEQPLSSLSQYVELLESQTTTQLKNPIIHSHQIEPSLNIHLLQDVAIQKLTHLDPQVAMEVLWDFPWNRWQDLINIVVGELSIGDLDQALLTIERVPLAYQEDAIRTLLASRTDISADDWVSSPTHSKLFGATVVRSLGELEALVLLDEPNAAWEQILRDSVDNDEQIELLVQIANARIESEGYEVLAQLYDSMFPADRLALQTILSNVLDSEPRVAFNSVRTMPYETRIFLVPLLLARWASDNPQSAYQALIEIEDYKQHRFESDVLHHWADQDPVDLLDNLNELQRGDRESAVHLAISELATIDPESIVERLAELEAIDGVADELELTLVNSWSQTDPVSALTWIQERTAAGSKQQGKLLYWALTNYMEVDADKTIEIALQQPSDSYFVKRGYVGSLFSTLVYNGQSDRAFGLLGDLPETNKSSAYLTLGAGFIEAGKWNDALRLAEDLEGEARDLYFRSIIGTAMYSNVTKLIDQLQVMSSGDTRESVARNILRIHGQTGDKLTDQQVEYVRSLLSDEAEDAERTETQSP